MNHARPISLRLPKCQAISVDQRSAAVAALRDVLCARDKRTTHTRIVYAFGATHTRTKIHTPTRTHAHARVLRIPAALRGVRIAATPWHIYNI